MREVLVISSDGEWSLVAAALPAAWRPCHPLLGQPQDRNCRDPILQINPETIEEPSVGPQRQLWEDSMRAASERLILHLIKANDFDSLNSLSKTLERFRSVTGIRFQNSSQVGCLILGWDPTEGELDQTRDLFTQSSSLPTIYVMARTLHPAIHAANLIHSEHVWPDEVARLLVRLVLSGSRPELAQGFVAWRSYVVRPHLSLEAEMPLIQTYVDQWLNILRAQVPGTKPPVWAPAPLRVVPEPVKGLSSGRDRLRRFVPLQPQDGDGAAALIHSSMQPAKWVAFSDRSGSKFRVAKAEQADPAADVLESGKQFWEMMGRLPDESNNCGPGLAAPLAAEMRSWLAPEDIQEKLSKPRRLIDGLSARDLVAADEVSELKELAVELDKARSAYVSWMVRLLAGGACLVILGFAWAQAVDTWSSVWSGRGTTGFRQATFLILGIMACVTGASAGVLVPWFLERERGRRGGVRLMELEALAVSRREEWLKQRLELCLAARDARTRLQAAAQGATVQRMVQRSAEIFRPHLHPVPTGDDGAADAGTSPGQETPVQLQEDIQRGNRARDRWTYSQTACMNLEQTSVPPHTPLPQGAIEALQGDLRRFWKEACDSAGFPRFGWMTVANGGRLVRALLKRHRTGIVAGLRTEYAQQTARDLNDQQDLVPSIMRWAPQIGGNLSLLSCSPRGDDDNSGRYSVMWTESCPRQIKESLNTRLNRHLTGMPLRVLHGDLAGRAGGAPGDCWLLLIVHEVPVQPGGRGWQYRQWNPRA